MEDKMAKGKLKNAAKAICFVLIAAIIAAWLTSVVSPKWLEKNAETAAAEHFYELDKDSIEVLFLGSSQITCCIDTMDLYEKYGILGYDIGGSHNSLMLNYYWLLEALQYQKKIKTVVVDTSLLFSRDPDTDSTYRKNLDYMRPSKNKYHAVKDYYDKIETPETQTKSRIELYTTFFFKMYKYHTRWASLDEIDFKPKKYDVNNYMGFTPTSLFWAPNISYDDFIIDNDDEDDKAPLRELEKSYLDKIISECKSRNIDVILIKTPKASWSKSSSNYCAQYAKENGIDFVDFNTDEALKAMDYEFGQDMRDRDHLNARGAKKLADNFGKYLSEHGDYTDFRKSNAISKKMLTKYHYLRDHCYVNSSDSFAEYVKQVNDIDDCTFVVQTSEDISSYWNEEYDALLKKMGIEIDMDALKGMNYFGVFKNGNKEFELIQEEPISQKLSLTRENDLKVACDISGATPTSTTFLKEKRTFTYTGLRISVIDNRNNELFSRLNIYQEDGELKYFVEESVEY
jgi:hypothetical protein